MIDEDLDGYYVTVYYPDYLENNIPFKQELEFRARSIYRTWYDISNGKILAEAQNYSKAKAMQKDFADTIKRFLRK